MKLSEVVGYLNLLESPELDPDYDSVTRKLDTITSFTNNHSLQFGSASADLDAHLLDIKSIIGKFNHSLVDLKQKIQQEIANQEPAYYRESTRLFEQDMVYETPDYILNRRLRIDFETDLMLRSKIKNYGDWRLPGMIIRPGLENYIEDMVPLDPLYVVDTDYDLLEPSISKFTPEYQHRLRPYVIDEYSQAPVFGKLPNNQFGFIFAYYYFNFKPVEIIEKFLQELYQKLRPGGTMIFTYNECDLLSGVGAAEHNWMCYTPGRRLRQIIDTIGFELLGNHIGEHNIAWFEIKKPGTIRSLRGGQTLAKIMPK